MPKWWPRPVWTTKKVHWTCASAYGTHTDLLQFLSQWRTDEYIVDDVVDDVGDDVIDSVVDDVINNVVDDVIDNAIHGGMLFHYVLTFPLT